MHCFQYFLPISSRKFASIGTEKLTQSYLETVAVNMYMMFMARPQLDLAVK